MLPRPFCTGGVQTRQNGHRAALVRHVECNQRLARRSKMTLKLPLAFSTLIVLAGGCSHSLESEAPMVPASGTVAPDERRISALSNARCDRELACQNIGPGKQWSTRPACVKELAALSFDELGPDECPKGIDRFRFDECMSDIADETCDRPLTSFERYVACHPAALCLD
jgi:hypothetical protein